MTNLFFKKQHDFLYIIDIALIKNNASVGAEIAVALSKISR